MRIDEVAGQRQPTDEKEHYETPSRTDPDGAYSASPWRRLRFMDTKRSVPRSWSYPAFAGSAKFSRSDGPVDSNPTSCESLSDARNIDSVLEASD